MYIYASCKVLMGAYINTLDHLHGEIQCYYLTTTTRLLYQYLYQLARRLEQLQKASWSASKIAKVAKILKPEYMSSEESEVDEENAEKCYKVQDPQTTYIIPTYI